MAVTATLLQASINRAEAIWKGGQLEKAKVPHADAAIALLKNQNADFKILQDANKDYVARIQWINPCIGGVQDCTPTCTISGAAVDTVAQDYTLALCKESVPLSIGEEVWRLNEFTQVEALALKIAQNKKAMDEFLAQQVLVYMKSFAGINFYLQGGTATPYVQNGNTTYIPAAEYNVGLLAYLELVAMYNQMPDTFTLSNEEFYQPWRNAQINSPNLNAQGDAYRAKVIGEDFYFDIYNFAKASITPEDMFIVEKGAMALVTKNRFPTTPYMEMGTTTPQWRWSEESSVLPGVYYDFYLSRTCNASFSSTQEDIVTNVKAKVRYGIFQNPLGCSMTLNGQTGQTTGVISLTKGTYVAP